MQIIKNKPIKVLINQPVYGYIFGSLRPKIKNIVDNLLIEVRA